MKRLRRIINIEKKKLQAYCMAEDDYGKVD